jgi:two-component system, sensor histidine kinase and response regulator
MAKPITSKSKFTIIVLIICLVPTLLNFLGISFSLETTYLNEQLEHKNSLLSIRGEILHSLMEWSAILIAGLVTVTSFIHYRLNKDISVPVIGLALLCSAVADAFHTLAALQFIAPFTEDTNFVPFTWALSRLFNSLIMIVAALLVLLFANRLLNTEEKVQQSNRTLLFIIAATFLIAISTTIYFAVTFSPLPQTLFPNALVTRPYDAIPLGLFVSFGVLSWLLYSQSRTAIRYALFISVLPQIVTQLHMVFGSISLYDNHFNIAHIMKVASYSVVFMGLLIDLIWNKSYSTDRFEYKSTGADEVEGPTNTSDKSRTADLKPEKKVKRLSVKLPLISFVITMFVCSTIGSVFYYESVHLIQEQQNFTEIEKLDEYFEQLKLRLILVGLSLVIIVFALSILASQKLTRPLTSIVKAMRRYQETGKLNQLPVKADDEIGEVARNFSLMVEQIEQKAQQQKQTILETNNVSARLQSILNSMVDAVINIDEQGNIIAFNRAAETMFGYSESEALGNNIKLLMPTEISEKHDGYLTHYKQTGEQHIIRLSRELPAMRKDGEVFPMILSVSEVHTGEGKIFTGLIRDITEEQLLQNEQERVFNEAKDLAWRLDFALSGPGIGVWDYEINTGIVSWDKRMYRLYGSDIESGTDPKTLWKNSLHPDDIKVVESSLLKSVHSGFDFKEIFRIILPDKSVNYIESYAKAFYSKEGEITRIVGTNRDITDQQNLHELKQQALVMAEESLKLKSEFLASMSHEIRTPMNGVLGMLGLLEQTTLDKKQEHYIQLASSSANSLLNIINDILDFSKIEAGKLDIEVLKFDLRALLGDVVESLALKAQDKGIELILNVNDVNDTLFKGDPMRIRQIISNLVNNAIKFTETGEILVTASTENVDNENATLRCSVKDTGIGIVESKVNTLFDSFTQVDSSTTREYGGTGLGLAIVKQLCKLMGGKISVESEIGKGSKFEFSLVLLTSQNPKLVMPSVEIKGTNILIVDDNETNLEVLEGQLRQWGALVTKARSGTEALDIVEQKEHGHYKIAILDMQMPQMDGASLGKALKQSIYCQNTKLIMMTSMGATGDAKYFAELGFSAYFPKPATTSDLFDAITIVLDNSEVLARSLPLVTHEHIRSIERVQTAGEKVGAVNILLVEDNRINQVVVQGMLESSGCLVDVAANGKEALEKLLSAQHHEAYHVILMDCQMPEMDGYEATKAIRASNDKAMNSEIPIIAMTANAMKGDREKCLECGMNDYIAKPVDSELLYKKLNQWTNGFEAQIQSVSEPDDLKEASKTSTPTEEKNIEIEEEIIWDEEGLLKRVRNNRVLAKKLVEMFLEDAPDLLKSILRSINKKEFQEAAATAHKIKGSVRNLGGVRLGSITHQVEQASKSENAEILQELVVGLDQAFSDFVAELEHSAIRV